MSLFCVEIVHTNLYKCISWFPARILYLELFDNASHACDWRQERHPVVKILLQYSSLTLLERKCYVGEVQPYRKTDYKPMMMMLCVLIVEGIYVAVNVMLPLMSPPPALCNLLARTVVNLGCICFRGELGFLNCDDICMCVVNMQFELLEFVFNSVYADLQYDEISLSLLLLGLSPCAVSVVMWSSLVCCCLPRPGPSSSQSRFPLSR